VVTAKTARRVLAAPTRYTLANMPEGRDAIPTELSRAVLVEAGHRCAIPTCRQHPVELAHIEPWSRVRNHTFGNLIALCPTCHARYDRGEIDRKAMLQYKAALSVLNSRYSDLERRILEQFAVRRLAWRQHRDWVAEVSRRTNGEYPKREFYVADHLQDNERAAIIQIMQARTRELDAEHPPDIVQLPGGQGLLLWYLTRDGYLIRSRAAGVLVDGMPLAEEWQLTPAGADFVDRWAEAQPLDLPELPLPDSNQNTEP